MRNEEYNLEKLKYRTIALAMVTKYNISMDNLDDFTKDLENVKNLISQSGIRD